MANIRLIRNVAISILLGTGIVLRAFWELGGTDWMYWFSSLAFAVLLLVPALTILIWPQFSLIWLSLLGRRTRMIPKDAHWNELKPAQKLVVHLAAFLGFVIGGIILCEIVG